MSTDLERRLTEAFHADARRARLINPDQPRETRSVSLSDTEGATGRRWLGVAAAVTILIVVGGLVLIRSGDDDAPAPISTAVTTTTVTGTTLPGETVPTAPGRPSQLFADIEPDTVVDLPSPPVRLIQQAAVWTGTEWITWGLDDPLGAGAAFDLATGDWRMIAEAPIDYRNSPAVAWTGSEMIVWGGNEPPRADADGAAYDPATDTWRLLPVAPLEPGFEPPLAVWTGTEVVVLGAPGGGAAAYDPDTNEWRRLADLPSTGTPAQAIWTGTAIVATLLVEHADDLGNTPILGRYDRGTDTWDIVEDANYAAIVAIPGPDGLATDIIALPDATGAPVDLLDGDGNRVGSLPGVPVDLDKFGEHIDARGLWSGAEAIFWVGGDSSLLFPPGPAEAWALDPATGTWRPLPTADGLALLGDEFVAAGDIVLAWSDDEARATAYRVPNPAG